MKNSQTEWYDSIYSDGSPLFFRPQSPALGDEIEVRLRALSESPITQVFVRIAPDGEEMRVPMRVLRHDGALTWWRGHFRLSVPRMSYRFKLLTNAGVIWYNAEGWADWTPTDDADFKILAGYRAPGWLPDRVFYQIFPDTFCDGDPSRNVRTGEYEYLGDRPQARKWGERPRLYRHACSLEFFGGDLAGIRQRVSHLQQLGVNALYLNPIFQAPSNHKYDTQDYFRIDPPLGTNAEFAELVQLLHGRGIRVMLDGVLNHSGVAIAWFQEARRDPASPYADFYLLRKHPDDYHCWLGVKTLPTLNYQSHGLREMIYAGPNSVVKYWLKPPYQIDAWRFDVANMLGRQGPVQVHHEVWRELRQAARDVNPEVYLMGEHSFDPTDLLQGDMLDGVMNYAGFTTPVRQWLTGTDGGTHDTHLSTAAMERQMRRFRSRLSWPIALNRYNLITCHDLPRLNAIARDERQLQLAAVLLLTYLGIPSIYYGDEIGLLSEGREIERSRQCMEWDRQQWNMELFALYRLLIRLRKQSPALQTGSLQTLIADGDIYAYARFTARQMFLIALNNGDAKREVWLPVKLLGVRPGQRFRDLLDQQDYAAADEGLCIPHLDAYSAMVLKKRNERGIELLSL